jgi:hypothetical protein
MREDKLGSVRGGGAEEKKKVRLSLVMLGFIGIMGPGIC